MGANKPHESLRTFIPRACRTKRRFATWAAASGFAKHCRRWTEDTVQPYACTYCGGFHIGSSDRELERYKRERRRDVESPSDTDWLDDVDWTVAPQRIRC